MPTAEILSIGTELLLGQVLDTNAQFISEELAKLGIDCYYRTTVGDNKERLKLAVKAAFARADIVIATGGLGPTADDLTTESVAELFGTPLILAEEVLQKISNLFVSMQVKMPPSNLKQALRPEGAEILPNPLGTAPGIIWKIDDRIATKAGLSQSSGTRSLLTFPGVPRELKAMWKATAHAYLQHVYGGQVLWSKELKHFGISESALAEKFQHLLNMDNPTIAPYAGNWECRLRVTAKAVSEEDAVSLARPIIEEIEEKSGYLCYGEDNDTLESVVGSLLLKQRKTLSVAESCTGGLLSARLTDISGSSEYIKLNVVTYSNEAKMKMLWVGSDLLEKYGAVSQECAQQMARGVAKLSGSDLGLSITGIAGPSGGTPDKPVGLVYIGLAAGEFYIDKKLMLPSRMSRGDIRYRTASEALNLVRLYLLGILTGSDIKTTLGSR